jgi:hypothetical protein
MNIYYFITTIFFFKNGHCPANIGVGTELTSHLEYIICWNVQSIIHVRNHIPFRYTKSSVGKHGLPTKAKVESGAMEE